LTTEVIEWRVNMYFKSYYVGQTNEL